MLALFPTCRGLLSRPCAHPYLRMVECSTASSVRPGRRIAGASRRRALLGASVVIPLQSWYPLKTYETITAGIDHDSEPSIMLTCWLSLLSERQPCGAGGLPAPQLHSTSRTYRLPRPSQGPLTTMTGPSAGPASLRECSCLSEIVHPFNNPSRRKHFLANPQDYNPFKVT
jgi:hypothetical protein